MKSLKQNREHKCGCQEPELTLDESGISFTVRRIMCKKHAEEYQHTLTNTNQ